MGATATLNIRLPEELKEHAMQVLAKQRISVSEAVRQFFCEMERSQEVPSFIGEGTMEATIQERRQLLRSMTSATRKAPQDLEPPIEPQGHDWREDWRAHLLEKSGK